MLHLLKVQTMSGVFDTSEVKLWKREEAVFFAPTDQCTAQISNRKPKVATKGKEKSM